MLHRYNISDSPTRLAALPSSELSKRAAWRAMHLPPKQPGPAAWLIARLRLRLQRSNKPAPDKSTPQAPRAPQAAW